MNRQAFYQEAERIGAMGHEPAILALIYVAKPDDGEQVDLPPVEGGYI